MDMASGGNIKEKYEFIYIEAPEEEAKIIFYNRFDHSPTRVSCTCCGEDYWIKSGEELSKLEHDNEKNVLIIRKEEIKSEEKVGVLPDQDIYG
jgi:ribosomal protein S27E